MSTSRRRRGRRNLPSWAILGQPISLNERNDTPSGLNRRMAHPDQEER